jgi:hypothetical protein
VIIFRKEIRFRAHDDELQATKAKMMGLEDRVFELQRESEAYSVPLERGRAERTTTMSSSSSPPTAKHSTSTRLSSQRSREDRLSAPLSGVFSMAESKKREERHSTVDDDDHEEEEEKEEYDDDDRRGKLSKSSVLMSSSMLSTRPSMMRLTSPSQGQSLFGGRSLKDIYSSKASERVRNIVENLSPARRKRDTMTMRSPEQSRTSTTIPRRQT